MAVAECLRNERGYEVIPAETVAEAARASQGVIDCLTPDGERDQALVAGLIEALAGTGLPFVYSSTAWVMGNTRGRLAGESFPLRPPPGLEWLPAVERLLFDTTVRGLRGVVIRPAVAYGRDGGLLAQLAEGALPLIGDGGNLWSFIHVDDLAELYVLAFESAPAGSFSSNKVRIAVGAADPSAPSMSARPSAKRCCKSKASDCATAWSTFFGGRAPRAERPQQQGR